jgi:hypothetical protein
MRKILLMVTLTVVAVAMLAFGAVSASAAAHFMSASDAVADSGALIVTWDESGLGNGNIDYSVSADATAQYACINNGGKNPSAANKRSFVGQVSGGGSFQSKNGRVRASLTAGPLSNDGFTCPGGQTLVLASVSYSNVVLTDTTNGVSITLPDVSRTFFTF